MMAPFAGACASAGSKGVAVPRPFPTVQEERDRPNDRGDGPTEAAATRSSEESERFSTAALVATALELRGSPYKNGGSTVDGFDCSGFTQFVFAQHGLNIPREVRDQFTFGMAVKRDEVTPGDLLFFSTTSRGVSHVGIAIDQDRFVHAPSSHGVVRVERLSTAYWTTRLVGVRRLPVR